MTFHVAHVEGFPPYVGGDDDGQDEWQASCACGWKGTMRGDSHVACMDALNHMNGAANRGYRPDPKPPKPYRASRQEWERIRADLLPAWCRVCGARRAESLHHVVRRSKSGEDVRANLLPVCGDGVRGCHGLIEARSLWALGRVREAILEDPAMTDYVVGLKGWGWLDRAYPQWRAVA